VPERRRAQAAVLALALLVMPVASFAQTVEERFDKGVHALEQNHYEDAVRYFADALQWSSDVPEIRFNLGKALYGMHFYNDAARHFELAAKSARDAQLKAKAKLGKGNALFRDAEHLYGGQSVARYMEAIEAYREALQLDPDLFHAEHNRKVAERRLQNPPRAPFAPRTDPDAPEPPAPNSTADAEGILKSAANGQAARKPVKSTPVERDW
jgi:tetratricopeptide (TPR) repeat protein